MLNTQQAMATVCAPQNRVDSRAPLRRTASDGPVSSPTTSLEPMLLSESSFPTHQLPSSPFQIQDDNADGEQLAARYQMLEELGSGSFGVVYKAIEKATGEIVAVKHVDLESSEEDLSDILSELAVLSSCSSSHVTKYKSAFLRKQTLWIVMEYLGGGSCADLLKPPPHRLTEAHIAIICRELLLGLNYLHNEGKLHRDIKAANVLLGMDGRVKLADFGVAAQLTGLKSMRNTFVGTPFWMAPEVIQQEGHDALADIWSLGITAIELAMGQPPHANVHPMKVLFLIPKQSAPRLPSDGGKWSKDFRDFVAQCLTKDVDRRPTAKQMLKHKFIRGAGRVEGLQELIQAKQEWEANRGGDRHMKYYAETLRQLKIGQVDEDEDDWVFETIKAPNMSRKVSYNTTTKRRKTDRISDVSMVEDTTTMMEEMSFDRGTSRRGSQHQQQQQLPEANSSVRRSRTKKASSHMQQRQPLGVNMSFGNSPSTVRQFRRVSPNADNNENKDPLAATHSPLKLEYEDEDDYANYSSMSIDQDAPPSPSPLSRYSSQASTIPLESKEAQLGRMLYSSAVGISCQNVLNDTANQDRRQAVSRLAEAFSDLEAADPEGLYHITKSIIEKISNDPKLRYLLPATSSTAALPSSQPIVRQVSIASICNSELDSGTVQRSPTKVSKPPLSRQTTDPSSPARLILAQNNPHLKSHRRRQSAQVQSRQTSQQTALSTTTCSPQKANSRENSLLAKSASPTKSRDEQELDKLIRGDAGLEHNKVMAEVLFERWCEGLKTRWPVG